MIPLYMNKKYQKKNNHRFKHPKNQFIQIIEVTIQIVNIKIIIYFNIKKNNFN
jgi:hypothetical protein